MPHNKNSNVVSENIVLVRSGKDYFSRLESIIHNSEYEIHIQVYLFENDATGNRIINALKEAASRQVKIYLILDGLGSFSFPLKIRNDLKQSGINFRFFAPLFSAYTFYLGRRLHQKIVVADSKVALIGGINIADKYHGTPTEKPWLDYAVQLNGEIAKPIQELCKAIFLKKRRLQSQKIKSVFHLQEDTLVRILQNDWLKRKNEISNGYIKSISNAKEEITIMGSYFLPGRRITQALKKAAKNKVRIRLILSGISDLPMTRRATCYLYSKLLSYDIELYEWNSSILHGKTAVIDSYWTTIGSFNLNNLSSYGSIETNVEINSPIFAQMYQAHLNQIIAQCQKITPQTLAINNTILAKFTNWISYYSTRIIEIIVTFTPYRRFYN
ncbi:phosphatidylserine/phosphatidylglycerophosphate/cardiolipin synthase family protein [Flavobacterium sp. LB3P45]|uniref:Phosphatidylserine/phosphatidylglycerophosphate/ cardiolipin synthase family protein n=1 Tax=Flavobacterium fructosi TaxID=3230416 RepID=A0ABW6HPK7_9FLAO